MPDLPSRLAHIRARILAACQRAGRPVTDVALMGVSKNHPPAAVAHAASLGLTLFGENRIQEARDKIPACPPGLHWHFIGHLQSNKAREAATLFNLVQGVDSLPLAEALQKQAAKRNRRLPILLEVNVAGESSKFGLHPDQVQPTALGLRPLENLQLQGLMTIAPYDEDPERARPHFRALRLLRDQLAHALGHPLPILSMGMSGDLETAIEDGSTLVRIGTALFGERQYPTSIPTPP